MLSRPRFLSSVCATYHGAHGGVGRREHRVPGPGVVVPAAVGLQVHVRAASRSCGGRRCGSRAAGSARPGSTSSQYLIRMMPESTIAFSTPGVCSRNALGLLRGAEAHHPLDAGAVVPAAVEDHDLAGGREVRRCSAGCTSATSPARSAPGSATTRNTRGLTRSVMRLIVPPLPAVSRPSKTMQTLAPGGLHPLLHGDQLALQAASSASYSLRRNFSCACSSCPSALLFFFFFLPTIDLLAA